MAEINVLPLELENKRTTGGRNPGSPYLSLKAITQDGNRRSFVVFEESLFPAVQEANDQQYPLRIRTGDTENSHNQVKDVLGKAEPFVSTSPISTGSADSPNSKPSRTDYYQFKPMNPEDREYDLRKNALNNASAASLERMRQTPGSVSFEPAAIADFTLRIADMYYEWIKNSNDGSTDDDGAVDEN